MCDDFDPSEFSEYEDELDFEDCLDEDKDLSEIIGESNSSFFDNEDVLDSQTDCIGLNQDEYEDKENEEDYEDI